MKTLIALTLAGLFACGTAFAADTKAADAKMTPQQEKMKTCNADAAGKTGDERKAFMKTCLSAKPAKKESKIAMCNKKPAGLNAEERKKAQSECMKG
jgi:glucose/arabinose dehydrogenase